MLPAISQPEPLPAAETLPRCARSASARPVFLAMKIGPGPEPEATEADAAENWTPSQIFWIVKNGVRMTGMPAFGPTHDDDRIWAIVAFVQTLQGMSSDQYLQTRSPDDALQQHGHDEHTYDHSGISTTHTHTHNKED